MTSNYGNYFNSHFQILGFHCPAIQVNSKARSQKYKRAQNEWTNILLKIKFWSKRNRKCINL